MPKIQLAINVKKTPNGILLQTADSSRPFSLAKHESLYSSSKFFHKLAKRFPTTKPIDLLQSILLLASAHATIQISKLKDKQWLRLKTNYNSRPNVVCYYCSRPSHVRSNCGLLQQNKAQNSQRQLCIALTAIKRVTLLQHVGI